MSILPSSNFDYTARDFEALRDRLFSLIQTHFVDSEGRPIWTDTQAKSFGNLLVELFCHVGDNLSYYRDELTLEMFLPTVKHRQNAIKVLRLISYELASASPATVDLKFTIPTALAGDVNIAERYKVYSAADPNVIYETLVATLIPAGSTEVTVSAENAQTVQDVAASTGLPNQRHVMSRVPYIDGTMEVTDPTGTWTEVGNFLSSQSTDRHFRTEIDALDRVTVIFGDGLTGAVPTGTITFDYRIGGGTSGRVEAGALTRLSSTLFDTFGTPAAASVTNDAASNGGDDREGIEVAKTAGPAQLRALVRTVAREDYEINGERADGVARTLMLTSNEVAGITENTGKLFVVATGIQLSSGRYAPATPNSATLAAVETEINVTRPHTVTFEPTVLAAPFKDVAVQATVYVEEGYTESQVRANVDAALADFFAVSLADGTENEEIRFGWYYKNADGDFSGELAWSDVLNVVRDTVGVRKVSSATDGFLLNGVRMDVLLDAQEFPRLGAVTLVNGDTGGSF